MSPRKSKDEMDEEKEMKRKRREEKRAVKRATERKGEEGKDILDIGRSHFAQEHNDEVEDHEDDDDEYEHAEEAPAGGGGYMKECFQWLISSPKIPPRQWETYRREEIEHYIAEMRSGIVGRFMPEWTYYQGYRRRAMKYTGDMDYRKQREGRGVCLWPDPPYGGGESYFGLWRENQPNAHGLFRWYNGDMYFGEWSVGKMQGYGVYRYGPTGPYAGDRFFGAYFSGLRQGTGVYHYAGGVPGQLSGIYMGEWVKGLMNGYGILLYTDGESYVGQWKHDKKNGLGTYVWGKNAGDFVDDKYEGQFHDGTQNGTGRTVFADGGWHKGEYRHGKAHGWGVMQRADGWEYIGKWDGGELDGEVMSFYAFGIATDKIVQAYDKGTFLSSRAFDTARDWSEIEAAGMEMANAGETTGADAREHSFKVRTFALRAKHSQRLAEDSADEARYWVKVSLEYAKKLQEWFGQKKYFIAVEA
mmetsp:Transcript_31503/g.74873  ORF Transcript_31503/g.74873 Transcript_31503/m.74873 type:complete len:472 (+) Transcript_31503:42-1457(+)